MKSVSSSVSKMDKTITNFLENSVVRFTLLLLTIAYLLMIKHIPTNVLVHSKNVLVRVIVALVIAYLACFEPLYAVMLGTVFILSLQELHNRNVVSDSKRMVDEKRRELNDVKARPQFLEDEILNNSTTDKKIGNLKEDRELGSRLANTGHPSDSTLTDNLNGYITNQNLVDAQNNLICGSDPNKPVEVFDKILNAQGLNLPSGHDKASINSSKF